MFSSVYHGVELAKINNLTEQTKIKKGTAKKGLVIVQMALSIIFLISTLMVYRQISFMKNRNLGVTLDNVIVCSGPASLNADPHKREKYEGFESDLLSQNEFRAATFNMFVPGQQPGYGFHEFNNPSEGKNPDQMFFENNAGDGLIDTYQLKLLAGNGFEKKPEQNHKRIIVSELGAKLLGFEKPEDAIGRQIYRDGNDTTALEIIGVVADFHNEGLHKTIYPVIWNNQYPREFGYFSVRLNTGDIQATLKKLETIWNRHYPKDNFSFVFAGEQFNRQYESDSRYSKFYLLLTLLSIGIATMGLYGLILFYLEKHKKEISLRKVNGATTGQVLLLLNLNFAKWVIMAFMVAVPVTWFLMHNWLENFAYKTSLTWWIFAISGLIVLAIALLTVSLQSWKAATRNPVEALRYE
jgi:putative ABC transport system permease protein